MFYNGLHEIGQHFFWSFLNLVGIGMHIAQLDFQEVLDSTQLI